MRCSATKKWPKTGQVIKCQLKEGHGGVHANGVEEQIVGGQRTRGPGPGAKTWE